MNLKISLGKTLDNKKDIYTDLIKDNINTIVISGPTGSGKSTFHHNIIKQVTKNNTPNEIGLVLMDFKRVEFGDYKDSDYLRCPVTFSTEEAVILLKGLIHESNQRYKGIYDSKKAIVILIEECDIVFSAPGLLEEVWKTIDEQSEKNNMYVSFLTSRPAPDIFTPNLMKHSNLKGWFIPGDGWFKFYDGEINEYSLRILGHLYKDKPEPWTRIFQFKDGKEIKCKGYV